MPILITATELAAQLASPTAPRVLDVRWRLDRPDGRADYLAGHIPGAVYVDLDTQLAAHGSAEDGRHPLPTVVGLQESARAWGIRDGDAVVVYDDLKSLSAARAWWLLTDAGIADVRILDGSFRAWTSAALPIEQGAPAITRGDVELVGGTLPVVSIDEAAQMPQAGVLLDARAEERYRGDVEPIDPRAGHIPGAVNAPATANVDDHGRFHPADELRRRFEELGVRPDLPIATYCGSGVTAAHNIVALTIAGYAPALYPGSWSQWAHHPDRPVATGATPEGGRR